MSWIQEHKDTMRQMQTQLEMWDIVPYYNCPLHFPQMPKGGQRIWLMLAHAIPYLPQYLYPC